MSNDTATDAKPNLEGESPPPPESQLAPPPPVATTESDRLTALAERLDRLQQSVAAVESALAPVKDAPDTLKRILAILEDRAAFDKAREAAVENMHKELTVFRHKGVDYARKQTLQNMLVLYDHFDQCARKAEGEVQKAFVWLREIFQETLFREDLEPVEDGPKKLDRTFHKVLKTVPTTDPEQDMTVAEVLKNAFRWHGELFRPEHVMVRRYTPPTELKETTSPPVPTPS